jgi:hypothetical protein
MKYYVVKRILKWSLIDIMAPGYGKRNVRKRRLREIRLDTIFHYRATHELQLELQFWETTILLPESVNLKQPM